MRLSSQFAIALLFGAQTYLWADASVSSIGSSKSNKAAASASEVTDKPVSNTSKSFVEKNASRQSKVTVDSIDQLSAKSSSETEKQTKVSRKARTTQPNKSARYHEFEIYDATSFLIDDIDGDGFFSEFEIVFDADTIYDWAEVYAVLYISRDGGEWQEYFVTDVFDIYGASGTDDYSVRTVLNFEFPTDEYEILIDLYEVGYSGIVATYSSIDDIDLAYLPLEDRTREADFSSGFWFFDVETDLIDDFDRDGYYSRFGIGFDADTNYSSASVYAEILFINESGLWELEFTTDDFSLQDNSSLDRVQLEFEWDSGYPTGLYDFKIVLRDSYSGQVLSEASGEFAALDAIPLESYDRDTQANSGGVIGSGGGVSSSFESGGSIGMLLTILSLLWLVRKSKR